MITALLWIMMALTSTFSNGAKNDVGNESRLERTNEFRAIWRWVQGAGDNLAAVDGLRILEYKDAGSGGLEWDVSGVRHSGNGKSQLWLMNNPAKAEVEFSVQSGAVAVMMTGDKNDGFARIAVDGHLIGEFDMYISGRRTLLITNLPLKKHTVSVEMVGKKQEQSRAAHVAIYGGAAVEDVFF